MECCFTGLLSFKRNQDLQAVDTFEEFRYQDEYGMYSGGFYNMFWWYCLHKFSKYIPYKLSIEKQRSVVDARGLDLQMIYSCQGFFCPVLLYLFENNDMCKQRALRASTPGAG